MSKFQTVIIGCAAVVFLGLYLFVPTKPRERAQIDKSRALEAESNPSITVEQLLLSARRSLSAEQLEPVRELEEQLNQSTDDGERAELLKKISSEWNKLNSFALGGFYANQVANITETDSAWAIAGTTFYSGFQQARDSTVKKFCMEEAITAFQNAISINSDNSEHQVNLALCYVNGGSEPMKGIMMIRDLAEKKPDDALASLTLGKLSMRTGQYEKAIQRFQNVLKHNDQHTDAHYWLGQAYLESGNLDKARDHFQSCLNISDNPVFKESVQNILNTIK